jgi:phosphatidylethanolamine-binding protein (PEBP) family uncharacterized protein
MLSTNRFAGPFVLALALVPISCGSGMKMKAAPAPSAGAHKVGTRAPAGLTPSATPAEKVPKVSIPLSVLTGVEPLSSAYTCAGANRPLPLRWGSSPSHTAELAVFVLSYLPVNGRQQVAWAVAGLNPNLRKLSSGALPRGAIVGENSEGSQRYSLCPPRGRAVTYAVVLYALPHKVALKRGFDAVSVVERKLVHLAEYEGEFTFSYRRP